MNRQERQTLFRHSRESGNPWRILAQAYEWIPAFAGMTIKESTWRPSRLGGSSISSGPLPEHVAERQIGHNVLGALQDQGPRLRVREDMQPALPDPVQDDIGDLGRAFSGGKAGDIHLAEFRKARI